MEIDFEKLMAGKPEEDLQKYISDSSRYTPEAITAAISEFKKRGITIPESELAKIDSEIKKKRDDSLNQSGWQKNMTDPKRRKLGLILSAVLLAYIVLAFIFHWPIPTRGGFLHLRSTE